MNKKQRKLLSILLAVICLVSGGLYASTLLDYGTGSSAYSEAEALALQAEPDATAESTEAPAEGPRQWVPAAVTGDPNVTELAKKSLTALRQENEDVVGWIWIPDTNINYPLMQGEDNDFYLEHTWQKKKNAVGSIFLEWQNSRDLSEFNTIVYGHNMLDDSMFSQLHDYREEGFPESHPYVYLLSDAGVWRYRVFATYKADTDSKTYQIGMQQEKTKQEYIDHALENSVIDTGCTPAVTDRILTLSTCSGMGYETRWVVHAYLPMELAA